MDKTMRNSIVIILFFFVSLGIYTRLFGPITFSVNNVNTENPNPFQATGTGTVKATPDKATVSLGITATSNGSDQARSAANTVINKVTSDLKSLGIPQEDIKTTNFSVNPNQQPGSETTIVGSSGYTANATVEVTTSNVDLANKAIDVASKDGANAIGGVNFTFDQNQQKELENQATQKAVADAKQKAQTLASAAGIKLGKVINISTDGNGIMPFAANAKSVGSTSDQTQLNPGENSVTVNVTLTFATN